MNYKDKNITVGSIAAVLPEASEIFEEYGIDFCCGGENLLSRVIEEKGINKAALFERLEEAKEGRRNSYENSGNDFNKMSSSSLSAYIEDKHHGYLRDTLPEAYKLLNTVLRVHGKNHNELFQVYSLFGQLKTDLEQHLLKEEMLLFPNYAEESGEESQEKKKVIKELVSEHEAAGKILKELRKVTNDYKIPEDACQTFGKAYNMLQEIEKDLHQHIHLENNLLFFR